MQLDDSEIIKINGSSDLEQIYTISPMSVPRSLLGSAEKKLVEILDLTRLPIYPELHFITLSIILLLGLYTSKKILDYPHLHFLTEKRANKKKKTVDPVPRPHEDYTI